MSRRGHAAIGLALPVLCGGCLSIFVDDQVVEVRTSGTDGAYCKVVDSTGRRKEVAYTPGFVSLPRGDGPINLRCEKDGFVGPDQRVDEEVNGWALLTGLLFWPGFVYDAISGAYQHYPDRIEVPMKAATGPLPPRTRRSDGIVRRSAGAVALGPTDRNGAVGALDAAAAALMTATPPQPDGRAYPIPSDVAPSGVAPPGASPVDTAPQAPSPDPAAPAARSAADPYADLQFGTGGFGGATTGSPQPSPPPAPIPPTPAPAPPAPSSAAADPFGSGTSAPTPGAAPAAPAETVTVTPPFARPTAGSGSVASASRAAPATPAAAMPGSGGSSRIARSGRVDPRQAMVLVPPPATGFGVQVGAYGVRENADIEIAYLNSLGLAAYTRRSANGRLTMVRFGPFPSRAAARAAARRYLQAGGGDAVVVRN